MVIGLRLMTINSRKRVFQPSPAASSGGQCARSIRRVARPLAFLVFPMSHSRTVGAPLPHPSNKVELRRTPARALFARVGLDERRSARFCCFESLPILYCPRNSERAQLIADNSESKPEVAHILRRPALANRARDRGALYLGVRCKESKTGKRAGHPS